MCQRSLDVTYLVEIEERISSIHIPVGLLETDLGRQRSHESMLGESLYKFLLYQSFIGSHRLWWRYWRCDLGERTVCFVCHHVTDNPNSLWSFACTKHQCPGEWSWMSGCWIRRVRFCEFTMHRDDESIKTLWILSCGIWKTRKGVTIHNPLVLFCVEMRMLRRWQGTPESLDIVRADVGPRHSSRQMGDSGKVPGFLKVCVPRCYRLLCLVCSSWCPIIDRNREYRLREVLAKGILLQTSDHTWSS